VASPAYEQILQIQAIDLTVDQLRHRGRTHPARTAMAEIDERLASHDAEVAVIEEQRHELERRQKRIEDEVAGVEDKRRDIDGKLYGGEVTASKDLLALQEEAEHLLVRQRGMEDEDLEIMEQLEELESDLASRARVRAGLEQERGAAEAELDAALQEIEGEVAELAGRRQDLARPANPELLARYESLRDQFDGVPVARLVDGRCDGCHIQLSAVAVDQMGRMPEEAVVTCEECGRLLVR
jgi:predicted  nucleic acid-binding Zn-ribbon protein